MRSVTNETCPKYNKQVTYISWSVVWWLRNDIIIIIIRHQWGLDRPFRPCLIVSSKVLQVVFVNLFYNSALHLSSHCCWFLLHVVAKLLCIILSYTLTGSIFISFKISSFPLWSKRVYPDIFLKKFISMDANLILSFFSKGPNFASN